MFKISYITKIGIINILCLLIFTISNIYAAIIKQFSLDNFILVVAPLLILFIISIITLIIKSLFGYGILYYIAGLSTAFLTDKNNIGAIIFLILAILCFDISFEKKELTIILLSVFFFVVFLKFAIFKIPFEDIIITSIFYLGAFGINQYLNLIKKGGRDGGGTK
jgi:hypothetical protein